MMPLSTSGCDNNTTIDNITTTTTTDNYTIISAITTSGCYNNDNNTTIVNIISTIDNITSANITSGCYNTTTDNNNTFLIDNTSLIYNTITNTTSTANTIEYNLTPPTTENKKWSSWAGESDDTFYDISYCYAGILGTVLTMIISGVVSAFIGPTQPNEVNESLVFPPAARMYRRVFDEARAGR
ncbi:hypothetical protein Pcinc_006785 [Petrolisthes cinctipes]|uniref:Uncharacterized protein n=1 Tax=Petrolisthes cinctipes TaxID=88211 RepID=A0AAE1G9X6_PETCI|nr:hypothetical protein Pcinc_006785 [Petrolisthes cinctipes]